MESNIAGKLKGISLDAFLQMAQMEQITCTLTVNAGKRCGQLFLKEGSLISAETDGAVNLEAAHRIISWDKSVIEIKESCSKTEDEIKHPLMNILMEAMRLRDEAKTNPDPDSGEDGSNPSPPSADRAPAAKKKSGASPDGKTGSSPKASPPPPAKEAAPQKQLPWKFIIPGLVVVLVAAGVTVHLLSASKRTRLAYETLLHDVEMSRTPNEKLNLLQAYVLNNPDSPHKAEANQKVEALQARKAELQFETLRESATELADRGDITGALAVYEAFLGESKESRYRGKAEAAIKTLRNEIEATEFESMKGEAMAQGPERLATFLAFLEKYPDSNHRKELRGLISEMEEEYFIYTRRRIQKSEASESWEECLELGRQFLDTYPETNHAESLTKLMVQYREELQAAQAFTQLCRRAESQGGDLDAARAVFSDYLEAYPGTPVKEKIEQEIYRLETLDEERRLSDAVTQMADRFTDTGSRFTVREDGTVLDKKSGLMWCLLDSRTVMDKCITYEEAEAYVAELETGGHSDWRVPTPEELLALFGNNSAFPSDSEQWYWSSKTQKRYVGQWILDVETVAPDTAAAKETETRESWQCGAVRACRSTG